MKNTIDNMFLSATNPAKGFDGIAPIGSSDTADSTEGFEVTFRQALAAIDGARSGKDLPKELLEFDPEKMAGMALTEKKLSSDSSVLIGESELNNQTVIAFAALQGMDADSLKTLFEKPVAEVKKGSDTAEPVLQTDTDTDTNGLPRNADYLVPMPPGSVDLTVKALEEQGLLPDSKAVSSMKGIGSESDLSGEKTLSRKGKSKDGMDGVVEDLDNVSLRAKSKDGMDGAVDDLDDVSSRAESLADQREIIGANDWLSSRPNDKISNSEVVVDQGAIAVSDQRAESARVENRESARVENRIDLAVLSKAPDKVLSETGHETRNSSQNTGQPEKIKAPESFNSELNATKDGQTKLNVSSSADVNLKGSFEQNSVSKSQTEVALKSKNSSELIQGNRNQPVPASEETVEFEALSVSKDGNKFKSSTLDVQANRIINPNVAQAHLANSVAQTKPLTSQTSAPPPAQVGEIAIVESIGSTSDSDAASELSAPGRGANPRVGVNELPGKLTALVQQRIANGLKVEGWRYQIHLHPEELGSVEIQMEMMDGRLEARILASNVGARDLLNEHLARLEESLQNGGIKESMLQVGLDQRENSKKPFNSNDGSQNGSQKDLADSGDGVPEDKRKNDDGGLDLFV